MSEELQRILEEHKDSLLNAILLYLNTKKPFPKSMFRDAKTINGLIGFIADKARVLADTPIDKLRNMLPIWSKNNTELVRYCKASGYSKGDMVRAILLSEFTFETDKEL